MCQSRISYLLKDKINLLASESRDNFVSVFDEIRHGTTYTPLPQKSLILGYENMVIRFFFEKIEHFVGEGGNNMDV